MATVERGHDDVAPEAAAAYGDLPGVVAVVLAGSAVTGSADERSDVDLYVYAAEPVPLLARAAVAARFAARSEVGNAFWEPGDEWIDARSGHHVDVMYRTPAWIEDQLERVLVRHEASVGYSTCFWHNVLHSQPLIDPGGWYRALQVSADRPYPDPLKHAVIARNHPLLRQAISSYLDQIDRAVKRGDAVSVQHRVAALLASYFDVLFAVNELPHPGEKRLLRFALDRCARLPPGMEARLNDLLRQAALPTTPAVTAHAAALLDGLDALLVEEGLITLDPLAGPKRNDSSVTGITVGQDT